MNTTKVYIENAKAWLDNYRVIANKGGTRSGKTYSLVSFFVSICTGNKHKRVIDIVSESLPHLKRGALNDIETILNNMGLVEMRDYIYNRSDRIYIFKTGSRIRFYSSDDWGKVKGSSRDILFINECNRIGYEVYRQLAVRTRQCIFLDWNPDSEFWYETKGIQTKTTTKEIHSTYKDNPYLTPEQIEEIESNKDDENWWKVYGLGQTGRPQGVVFKNWEQCNDIPRDATFIGRGLDFGFTQDPTAIIDVYKYDGKLWLDEVCYKKGLTNDRIADILRGRDGWTVADSAEMKSITEIYNYGIRKIEPAEKGQDSVRNGIQIMQRYKLMVTSRSLNLIYELRNYRWKENKLTGELLNEPVDKYNHCFTGDTLVLTKKGEIRIDKIKVGDLVLTSNGYKKVTKTFDNGYRKILHIKLIFSNLEVEVKATADHKFKTSKGWKQLQELTKTDLLYTCRFLTGKSINCTKGKDIFQEVQGGFIGLFGNTIMEKFQKVITFITKMKTPGIMKSKTLNLSRVLNILENTWRKRKRMKSLWKRCVRQWITQEFTQINGTVQKKVENGTKNTVDKSQLISSQKNMCANTAGRNSIKNLVERIYTAAIIVNKLKEGIAERMMKCVYARYAEGNFRLTSILKRKHAVKSVQANQLEEAELKDVKLINSSIEHVYDIEVEEKHEYFAQGILVHNCIDAARYVCLNKLSEKPRIKKPKSKLKDI